MSYIPIRLFVTSIVLTFITMLLEEYYSTHGNQKQNQIINIIGIILIIISIMSLLLIIWTL